MNKAELIKINLGFQEEINRLILEYKVDKWLSLDLTMMQLKSVVFIYSRGKVNYKELARALNVTPSVVTGIVDRLLLHGLVRRRRMGSPPDRRIHWLMVTNEGKALLDNIRQQTSENISQILETMRAEDLIALVQGFSALFKAAEVFLRKKRREMEITSNIDETATEKELVT